jgi:hypothetical protein
MEKISSYTIGVTIDALRDGLKLGKVPEPLHEPLQSLLPHIARAASEAPTSIYLFSNEENAEARDLFGYALANALLQHIPSTLLVDCGFLNIGLNGVVPQKDALGFLDLLLYGSSLGVITQETTGGVQVVGAGSFPVTKKMPFVLNAFEDAARRLVTHSRCAIFCGPLYDDEGEPHPLIGAVNMPVLLRTVAVAAAGAIDPIEEQLSSGWGIELTSVRITPVEEPPAPPPPVTKPEPVLEEPEVPKTPRPLEPVAEEPGFEETAPPEPTPAVEPPAPTPRVTIPEPVLEEPEVPKTPRPLEPAAKEPDFEEIAPPEPTPTVEPPGPPSERAPDVDFVEERAPRFQEKRYTSLLPKIATAAIVAVVVVFIVWWFRQERPSSIETAPVQEPLAEEVAQTQQPTPETGTGDQGEGTPVDTTVATPVRQPAQEETQEETQEESTGDQDAAVPEEQPERTPPPGSRIDSDDIIVMDDLESNWAGYHLIHISSFRESAKARTEITNLERRGFPVFIVFLDLGAKGKWYRVYAGPLDTRDDARNMKKLLDGTPGVRFTRITRIAK